jgi:predicted heme/steroid binding protein
MRVFTREELKRYDGRQGIVYVAYNGKVYDVVGTLAD